MASDEKTPLKLPPELKVTDSTSETQNLYPTKENAAEKSGKANLKTPHASQRHTSQWTYSLSQIIKKRNKFQRLVEKNGDCNILHTHLKYKKFRFLSDMYTTLIDLSWGHVLLLLTLTYLISWFFFAVAWYMVAWIHGDLIESNFFTFAGRGGGHSSQVGGSSTDYVYGVPGVETTDFGTTVHPGEYYNSNIRPTDDTKSASNNDHNYRKRVARGISINSAFAENSLGGSESSSFTYQDPCIYNVHTFFGAFLFSVETQTTIGYGFRFVSEACVYAAALEAVQNILSYIINTIMLGLIFAKICNPSSRTNTLKFSRHAVIAMRNGKLCFMFRVGNIRNSHLFEPHIRAYVIKPSITDEGEYVPLYHHNMDFNYSTGENRTLIIWPVIICHVIDENSPLYELSAQDLDEADLEIMVFLEGVVEQTGLTTQARTSYIPSEIKWGYRFSSSVITLNSLKDRMYKIDYKKFNSIYQVPDTPEECAKDIYREAKKKQKAEARKRNKSRKHDKTHVKVLANTLSKSTHQGNAYRPSLKSPEKLQAIEEDINDSLPSQETDDNIALLSQEPQASATPVATESASKSPETIQDLGPYHDILLQSLQHLAVKIHSLESSLERNTLEEITFTEDSHPSDPTALTEHFSSPRLTSPKKKHWDPKKIGLELKRRNQGSSSAPSSSEEESYLVPLDDDLEDEGKPSKPTKEGSCIVS